MFLKSITIQGFKSFAKKVVIDLSSDVTGVVGPNGSGKSNVAEAIRFVLGEQSMKGLRSKSGSDLIFKGSAHLSALSRASVSITLNNQDKKINQKLISASSQMSDILINFINLDEIILTREIYADGQSEYTVNNTKVRLKDVQELLALAQISAAGHTIINQGEADKILLSNNKERREILEEALGLRIYHMRIKESEKKLSKVSDHLREIDLMRKENLPHLNFLKKQIEKLESREKEVENISTLLKIYLSREDEEINKLKSEINFEDFDFNLIEKYKNEIKLFEEKKKKNIISSPIIDNQEIEIQNPDYNLEEKNKIESLEKEILEIKNELNILNTEYENKYKESVNIDLEIKFLEKKSENKKLFIEENQLENFEMSQEKIWDDVLNDFEKNILNNIQNTKINLEELRLGERKFVKEISGEYNPEEILNLKNDFDKKKNEIENILENINSIKYRLDNIILEKDKLEKEIEEKENKKEIEIKLNQELEKNKANNNNFEIENKILSLRLDLQKLESKKENVQNKKEILKNKETNFENILNEMRILIGASILNYKNSNQEENINTELNKLNQFELSRKIERSKIKIEETGVVNAGEIVQEYNTLKERDEFLSKEIEDLTKSKSSLTDLITDLQNTLLTDFNEGLKTINDNFNNYFAEIFTGGSAGLKIEEIEEKKSSDIFNGEIENENEEEKISGIEISVSLPQKKVKDLQMLSGGERALTSIALIFAMSSINHPPFMVLDETDAALDESNARRYGKMIQKLSEKSKLLVITHNRETMNRCDVLYGVTVGAEGSSKLLSIKFDEATEYAK